MKIFEVTFIEGHVNHYIYESLFDFMSESLYGDISEVENIEEIPSNKWGKYEIRDNEGYVHSNFRTYVKNCTEFGLIPSSKDS